MDVFKDIRSEIVKSDPSSYRFDQFYQALTKDLVQSFDDITTFSKGLRNVLSRSHPGFFPRILDIQQSGECIKFLIGLRDGSKIETVLIGNSAKSTNTVCCSTQVGCPVGCEFCSSGKMGLGRNLDSLEIAQQVFTVANFLKKQKQQVTNVVVMGMGEPFLNFDNLIAALEILNDGTGFDLAARKISVSTVGIVPAIRQFAEVKEQFNLAISLHSPFQDQRQKLMPIARKYLLDELMAAAKFYITKTNRKVMLEYLLLKDVNLSLNHLDELIKVARSDLFHVNLVKYNDTTSMFTSISDSQAREVLTYLKDAGVNATLRKSAGTPIRAACGQLATE